jgi:hypothetical protein
VAAIPSTLCPKTLVANNVDINARLTGGNTAKSTLTLHLVS